MPRQRRSSEAIERAGEGNRLARPLDEAEQGQGARRFGGGEEPAREDAVNGRGDADQGMHERQRPLL